MERIIVILNLSNGDSIRLNPESIIFVYNGDTVDIKEPYASGGMHYTLNDHRHHSAGYAPFLIGLLADNDFFSIETEDVFEAKIFKSSSVVSIEHSYDDKTFSFK